MSTSPVLATELRTSSGSASSRRARAAGRVPVNIYGHGGGNITATVNAHDLGQALASTAQVFTFVIDGKNESCLVKEVQYDTFGQEVLHVDLARINLAEEVSVDVALDFVGNPVGQSEGGNKVIHRPQLPVRCSAGSIPDEIRVDVAGVKIGDTITAADIVFPEGVVLDLESITADEAVFSIVADKRSGKGAEDDDEAGDGDAS